MKIPENQLHELSRLTKEDNEYWIILGRETCNLNRWYHNCYDVVANSFGKNSSYAKLFDVGFFMEKIRDPLDAEIKKIFRQGSPEERAFIEEINRTSLREIQCVSQVFYFTETIQKANVRETLDKKLNEEETKYVREFEKRILEYFDFIKTLDIVSLSWYEEWYVELMRESSRI
jgi:hypothetical protein